MVGATLEVATTMIGLATTTLGIDPAGTTMLDVRETEITGTNAEARAGGEPRTERSRVVGIGGDGPRVHHRGTRGILPIAPRSVTIDPGEMTGLTTGPETTGRRDQEDHHPLTTPTRPRNMGMALDRDTDLVPGGWVNRPHGRISGMECRPSLPEDRRAAAAEEAGTAQWISRGESGTSLRKVFMLT